MSDLDSNNRTRRPRIFMMDLWATVPYYTAYLSKALLADGVDLTVGSITYYLDTECFTSRGIKVDPGILDFAGRFQLPRLPRRVLKLAESMLNISALAMRFLFSPPDVVHVQYLPMLKWRVPLDLWFLEYCRKQRAKIILTVHDLMPHDTAESYKHTFYELYAMVDGIICHSDNIKKRLHVEFAVPEEKISVIPHGPFFYDLPKSVDPSILRTFEVDPCKKMILWQGIIFPYKGIDLLLSAWQKVEAMDDSVYLVIAGTGAPELLDQIRTQVVQLGLKSVKFHFRFITTEELVALYRVADIVVYPYRAITTSGALATGLALGKTIVASDLPVFREALKDRENARLVDVTQGNELASVLSELVQDTEQCTRLAERVRDMNFGDETWQNIARATFATYVKSLKTKSGVETRD
jgi:glycosyltransferase involved in cell wall biosynthesis